MNVKKQNKTKNNHPAQFLEQSAKKELIILNKRKHTKSRNREVADKPEHPHEAHKFEQNN